jgi:tetratricopeptide (TPR) repeat protein
VLEPQIQTRPGDARRHAQLGLAYAGLGRRDEAIEEGRRAKDLLPVTEDAYSGAALADNLAHIFTIVGDNAQAIEEIGSILSVESPVSIPWLRVDPTWDPLRGDPDFRSLLEDGGS